MQKIKVISEPTDEKPFVIIYKPQGLPSAPLKEDENSALTQAEKLFPEIKSVSGRKKIEYGLLHRIDTQTEGLLLIAASQFFYDNLQAQQADGKFIKTYLAECVSTLNKYENEKPGYPPIEEKFHNELEKGKTVEIRSFFRNYGEGLKSVRPVTENSGKAALKKLGNQKEYSTKIKLLSKNESFYNFECKISSGYRHQVRCHLAWLDFPIVGDKIYNINEKNANFNEKMMFKASALEFINPITQKEEKFNLEYYPEGDLNP